MAIPFLRSGIASRGRENKQSEQIAKTAISRAILATGTPSYPGTSPDALKA